MTRRIGLLGGSFDPVHKGHVQIAKYSLKKLKLDELWFIPVLNNPFKDRQMASGADRCAMLECVIQDEPRFKICDVELKGNPELKSFTYYTLLYLIDHYPDTQFYYIIGDDQVAAFDRWYEAEKISQLVTLVCFARKGYEPHYKNIKKYHMQRLDMKPIKASSTAIREGDLTQVEPAVIQYFTMHGLYLKDIVKHYMSEKRYAHTCSMANLAVEIAKANQIDPMKAYVAGMLHDIAKEMPEKKAEKLMQKYYPEYIDKPQAIWHQWLSSYVAKNTFYVKDKEILQAITNHTTASSKMSLLDMCIYCADKYDPGRGYDSSREIALCKKDICEGFKQSLIDFVAFSKQKNRAIDPIFNEVYETYVKEDRNG
ncbi:MAG TPA: nicotinate-nucleotide adenylyltransferase [Candidatus Fimiplasma intestinipullorum]|uniref:Probable nicotinate-nucleotide adenylyltransferase n=1 Tax=Candidatus Fimiplasma intestinipullorum TaxID=2840825 RepID=A0A9D1HQA6_9FIRM|nr:nicotinate-nucleotide adenylyltransferase [Candidatus Fimiplasma intestinipullorum]